MSEPGQDDFQCHPYLTGPLKSSDAALQCLDRHKFRTFYYLNNFAKITTITPSLNMVISYFCNFFLFFISIFFNLFLAALGLCCCARAFSSCSEWGLLFFAVHGLLIAVASRCRAWALGSRASVVVARGVSSCGSRALERRLSSCSARAQLLRGMWDLPACGIFPDRGSNLCPLHWQGDS